MKLHESFANALDASLIDYRGEFEVKDDYILKEWIKDFIKDFKDGDYSIEYIDNERYINVHKDINIVLKPGETKMPYKFNKVDGTFNCSFCGLTSLEGCPRTITKYFICSFNNLRNIDFLPDAEWYDFRYNQLNLGSLNKLIEFKRKNEKHTRHNLDRSKYKDGTCSYKSSIVAIDGNPKLIKYKSHPLYHGWFGERTCW